MRKPFRIHTTKYLAATRLLSATEHGALLSIMLNVFDVSGRFNIADDNIRMSQLAGMSVAHWLRVKKNVTDVLVKIDGRWSWIDLVHVPRTRKSK